MSFGQVVNALPASVRVDRRTAEQRTFGESVQFHDLSGLPLEVGIGCLPPDVQALHMHCDIIEARDGPVAAGALRFRLRTRMAAAAAELAQQIKEQMK
jgi:hypothetical protein